MSGKIGIVILGLEQPGVDHCSDCKQLFERGDLRPYGKDGTLLCYDCGMKPENKPYVQAAIDKRFREGDI